MPQCSIFNYKTTCDLHSAPQNKKNVYLFILYSIVLKLLFINTKYLSRWKFTTGAVPCQYRRWISGIGRILVKYQHGYWRCTGYTPNYNSARSCQSVLGWYLKIVLVKYYQPPVLIYKPQIYLWRLSFR